MSSPLLFIPPRAGAWGRLGGGWSPDFNVHRRVNPAPALPHPTTGEGEYRRGQKWPPRVSTSRTNLAASAPPSNNGRFNRRTHPAAARYGRFGGWSPDKSGRSPPTPSCPTWSGHPRGGRGLFCPPVGGGRMDVDVWRKSGRHVSDWVEWDFSHFRSMAALPKSANPRQFEPDQASAAPAKASSNQFEPVPANSFRLRKAPAASALRYARRSGAFCATDSQ